MKQTLSCLVLAVLCLGMAFGQSLSRQVIGSAGTYTETPTLTLSATVGEAAYTQLITGTLTLLQGFQQPDGLDMATNRVAEVKADVLYTVYPNPTTDRLMIELETDARTQLSLRLADLNGRILREFNQELQGRGILKTAISLASLPAGVYLLSFVDPMGNVLETRRIHRQ